MIFNGPRFLIFPSLSRTLVSTPITKTASWLIAAALTAAVWPALAVVGGHIGSALLGREEVTVAVLRAVVGLTAVVGGAIVAAPALTLLVLWTTETAKENTSPDFAGTVAMGILWPAWAGGLVLAVPPLLGLGPELGEIMWALLAALIAFKIIKSHSIDLLGIRRRWALRFKIHMASAFVLLFVLVAITPPMAVRSILGAATQIVHSLPDQPDLPLPPLPNW
jgi:hypothetical protein